MDYFVAVLISVPAVEMEPNIFFVVDILCLVDNFRRVAVDISTLWEMAPFEKIRLSYVGEKCNRESDYD